eukprot:EG_transcript_29064
MLLKAFLLLCCVASAPALSLTKEAFQTEVLDSGKNAFIKFFAPWCGHCKAMAPAWETLMNEYAGSKSVVVAEVDCTVQDKLCSDHGVSGYPTIKYWEGGEKKDYSGGRSVDELRNFVVETLDKSSCNVDTLADCSKKEIKYIEKVKDLGASDLAEKREAVEKLRGNKFVKDAKFVAQRLAILRQLEKKQ